MRTFKEDDTIRINLTAKEVCSLEHGSFYSERAGVTLPDSKVTVFALSQIDPNAAITESDRYGNDRLSRAQAAVSQAFLDGDADLRVYVSDIATTDVRVARQIIPRDQIKTQGDEVVREAQLSVVPGGGIIVNFGGSRQDVNVMDYNYSADEPEPEPDLE